MSLATMGRLSTPPLPNLVDGLASRTGSWVLVEQLGTVLCHGVGADDCPPALAQALLGKTTAPLRAVVRWSRGGSLLRGRLQGIELVTADLGEGSTAWVLGGHFEGGEGDLHRLLPMLAAAVHDNEVTHCDLVMQELLHPRGLSRPGQAPPALLLVLRSEACLNGLARAATTITAGTSTRVHVKLPLLTRARIASGRGACPQ